jgi:putative ABC transport system ATP-binding protein
VVKTFKIATEEITVLKGIDASIQPGEFVAVIGKSGSGKSTLLNMVTGIDRPTAGEVLVGGASVHSMSENEMAAWRGRTLGIVFQFFQLLPMLSLVENIMLPMDFCNLYTARQRKERAM